MEDQGGTLISVKDHVSHLTEELYQLLLNQILCDVTLIIDDGEIQAHSPILCSASPFFCRVIVSRVCRERIVIAINGFDIKSLKKVLQFIYTGKIVISSSDVNCILKLLKRLEMESVIKQLLKNFPAEFLNRSKENIGDNSLKEKQPSAVVSRPANVPSWSEKLRNALKETYKIKVVQESLEKVSEVIDILKKSVESVENDCPLNLMQEIANNSKMLSSDITHPKNISSNGISRKVKPDKRKEEPSTSYLMQKVPKLDSEGKYRVVKKKGDHLIHSFVKRRPRSKVKSYGCIEDDSSSVTKGDTFQEYEQDDDVILIPDPKSESSRNRSSETRSLNFKQKSSDFFPSNKNKMHTIKDTSSASFQDRNLGVEYEKRKTSTSRKMNVGSTRKEKVSDSSVSDTTDDASSPRLNLSRKFRDTTDNAKSPRSTLLRRFHDKETVLLSDVCEKQKSQFSEQNCGFVSPLSEGSANYTSETNESPSSLLSDGSRSFEPALLNPGENNMTSTPDRMAISPSHNMDKQGHTSESNNLKPRLSGHMKRSSDHIANAQNHGTPGHRATSPIHIEDEQIHMTVSTHHMPASSDHMKRLTGHMKRSSGNIADAPSHSTQGYRATSPIHILDEQTRMTVSNHNIPTRMTSSTHNMPGPSDHPKLSSGPVKLSPGHMADEPSHVSGSQILTTVSSTGIVTGSINDSLNSSHKPVKISSDHQTKSVAVSGTPELSSVKRSVTGSTVPGDPLRKKDDTFISTIYGRYEVNAGTKENREYHHLDDLIKVEHSISEEVEPTNSISDSAGFKRTGASESETQSNFNNTVKLSVSSGLQNQYRRDEIVKSASSVADSVEFKRIRISENEIQSHLDNTVKLSSSPELQYQQSETVEAASSFSDSAKLRKNGVMESEILSNFDTTIKSTVSSEAQNLCQSNKNKPIQVDEISGDSNINSTNLSGQNLCRRVQRNETNESTGRISATVGFKNNDVVSENELQSNFDNAIKLNISPEVQQQCLRSENERIRTREISGDSSMNSADLSGNLIVDHLEKINQLEMTPELLERVVHPDFVQHFNNEIIVFTNQPAEGQTVGQVQSRLVATHTTQSDFKQPKQVLVQSVDSSVNAPYQQSRIVFQANNSDQNQSGQLIQLISGGLQGDNQSCTVIQSLNSADDNQNQSGQIIQLIDSDLQADNQSHTVLQSHDSAVDDQNQSGQIIQVINGDIQTKNQSHTVLQSHDSVYDDQNQPGQIIQFVDGGIQADNQSHTVLQSHDYVCDDQNQSGQIIQLIDGSIQADNQSLTVYQSHDSASNDQNQSEHMTELMDGSVQGSNQSHIVIRSYAPTGGNKNQSEHSIQSFDNMQSDSQSLDVFQSDVYDFSVLDENHSDSELGISKKHVMEPFSKTSRSFSKKISKKSSQVSKCGEKMIRKCRTCKIIFEDTKAFILHRKKEHPVAHMTWVKRREKQKQIETLLNEIELLKKGSDKGHFTRPQNLIQNEAFETSGRFLHQTLSGQSPTGDVENDDTSSSCMSPASEDLVYDQRKRTTRCRTCKIDFWNEKKFLKHRAKLHPIAHVTWMKRNQKRHQMIHEKSQSQSSNLIKQSGELRKLDDTYTNKMDETTPRTHHIVEKHVENNVNYNVNVDQMGKCVEKNVNDIDKMEKRVQKNANENVGIDQMEKLVENNVNIDQTENNVNDIDQIETRVEKNMNENVGIDQMEKHVENNVNENVDKDNTENTSDDNVSSSEEVTAKMLTMQVPISGRRRRVTYCRTCAIVFKSTDAYQVHRQEVHPLAHKNWVLRNKARKKIEHLMQSKANVANRCQQCNVNFPNQKALLDHSSEFHSATDNAGKMSILDNDKSRLPTQDTGNVVQLSEGHLEDIEEVETSIHNIPQEEEGHGDMNKDEGSLSVNVASGEVTAQGHSFLQVYNEFIERFICDSCGFVALNATQLEHHVKKHTESSPQSKKRQRKPVVQKETSHRKDSVIGVKAGVVVYNRYLLYLGILEDDMETFTYCTKPIGKYKKKRYAVDFIDFVKKSLNVNFEDKQIIDDENLILTFNCQMRNDSLVISERTKSKIIAEVKKYCGLE